MEERFEDRARDCGPISVVLDLERLVRSQRDDLGEPSVQLALWRKALKRTHDRDRFFLKRVNFEALVIEAVDGILVAPMVVALVEQRL